MLYVKIFLTIVAILAIFFAINSKSKNYFIASLVFIFLYTSVRWFFMGGPGMFPFVMALIITTKMFEPPQLKKPPDYDPLGE